MLAGIFLMMKYIPMAGIFFLFRGVSDTFHMFAMENLMKILNM
jgi:hypothetical protein